MSDDRGADGGLSGAEIALLAAAGGLGAAGLFAVRHRRRGAETRALKKAVEEDLVALGTDIRALDLDVELPKASQAAKDDYGEALDAYEQESDAFDRVREPGDIGTVTDALDRGRYAMASANARLEGREPPARRPPCFFDPRHGPSAKDVEWAPPGRRSEARPRLRGRRRAPRAGRGAGGEGDPGRPQPAPVLGGRQLRALCARLLRRLRRLSRPGPADGNRSRDRVRHRHRGGLDRD